MRWGRNTHWLHGADQTHPVGQWPEQAVDGVLLMGFCLTRIEAEEGGGCRQPTVHHAEGSVKREEENSTVGCL